MSNLLDDYFTDVELAESLGVTKRTVKNWRSRRIGPPTLYIGRIPYTRKDAAREWMLKRESNQIRAAEAGR